MTVRDKGQGSVQRGRVQGQKSAEAPPGKPTGGNKLVCKVGDVTEAMRTVHGT